MTTRIMLNRTQCRLRLRTYHLATKDDILATNHENTSRNVTELVANVYTLNGTMKNQISYN